MNAELKLTVGASLMKFKREGIFPRRNFFIIAECFVDFSIRFCRRAPNFLMYTLKSKRFPKKFLLACFKNLLTRNYG